MARNLMTTARTWKPDFVHCPQYRGFGLPVLLASRCYRIPFGLYIHGTEIRTEMRSAARKAILRRVIRGTRFIATNSAFTRGVVASFFPEAGDKLVVLHPGVHPDRFLEVATLERAAALRAQWIERLGLDSVGDAIIILALCRVCVQKGLDLAIRAFASLRRSHPSVPVGFVMVGGGPDIEAFGRLAAQLGVGDRVLFAGLVPYADNPACYVASDVYLQPSQLTDGIVESFGISFLEAQAAGKPCVGTRVGGIPEAMGDDGDAGCLVDPGSVEAVESALSALITDPDLRRTMGEAGLRRAANRTWKAHAAKLDSLIRDHVRA